MFAIKRPCSNCPFARGAGKAFRLGKERVLEIVEATAFQCHKTVEYTDEGSLPGDKPQQCAGLMSLLAAIGRPNAIMKVAVALDSLDLSELDPLGEAYKSLEEALKDHGD